VLPLKSKLGLFIETTGDKMKLFILALTAIFSYNACAVDVSAKTILNHLNDKSTKVIISDIKQIYLEGNEEAYLASAEYPDQGRNFIEGYILYRPSLKSAMKIDYAGGQANKIIGVYSYNPSIVHIEGAGSGQGHFTHTQHLVSFNGWNIKELYSVDDESNSGTCGIAEGFELCTDSETFINYSNNLSTENKIRIFVTKISQQGPEGDSMKSTYTTNIVEIPKNKPNK
jgi:hypothetical protein